MYTEIEAKLKVDSLEEVEARLKELGAEFIGEQLQKDTLFDDDASTLTKHDSCVRLRKQVMSGREKCIMTYKGAKEKSNLKKRLEIETEVSDCESTKAFLTALGYKEKIVVEKTRSFWKFGGCEVALDSLNLLGSFVEIEGPSEEVINNVQKSLGLEKIQNISKSYATLIAEKLQQENKQ